MAIDATKPKTAAAVGRPVEAKKSEPVRLENTSSLLPKKASEGFDLQRKKLMSVSGRYAAPRAVISDREDLKQLVSAQRAAAQAGGGALLALATFGGGDEDAGVGGSGGLPPNATPLAGPTVASSVKAKLKDEATRTRHIEHMLRGNDPGLDEKQRKKLDSAMRSLSTSELAALDKAGVRVWQGVDYPPEYAKAAMAPRSPLSSTAAYHPGAKVLQLNPNSTVSASAILHELGHAKDDMLDDPAGLKPILEYGEKTRSQMLAKSAGVVSDSTKTFKTQSPNDAGKLKEKSMTISQMYDAYVARSDGYLKDDLFHSPTQRTTYARRNAQEFFGEAFAVFRGGDPSMQKKLLEQAPEIYFMLEADAKKNGAPVPDRKALEKL